jgi:hypothetical protein
MIGLCECGCGKKVTKEGNKYIWGHNSRGHGYPSWKKGLTKESDIRVLQAGKKCSGSQKRDENLIAKRKEIARKMGLDNLGRIHDEKTKEKDRISTQRRWDNMTDLEKEAHFLKVFK